MDWMRLPAALFLLAHTAVCFQLMSIDNLVDKNFACLMEGYGNVAFTWTADNLAAQFNSTLQPSVDFWPTSKYISLSSIGWVETKSSELVKDFGPISDVRWNDLQVTNKILTVNVTGRKNFVMHFSVLADVQLTLETLLDGTQKDFYINIDQCNKTSSSGCQEYSTILQSIISDGSRKPPQVHSTSKYTEPQLKVGKKWVTFSLEVINNTLKLKNESQVLIQCPNFSYTMKSFSLKANDNSYFKLHDVSFLKPSDDKPKSFSSKVLVKSGSIACVAVTYASASQITLHLAGKRLGTTPAYTTEVSSPKWRVQKFLGEEVQNTTQELNLVIGGKHTIYLARIRTCSKKEYVVLHRKVPNDVIALRCSSLQLSIKRPDESELRAIVSENEMLPLEGLVCGETPYSNVTTNWCKRRLICIDQPRCCFCWRGWSGNKCGEVCGAHEHVGKYGLNCREKCGDCANMAACDGVTGHCPGECDNMKQVPRPFCKKGDKSDLNQSDYLPLIVGGAVTLLILLLLAGVLGYVLWRRRTKKVAKEDQPTVAAVPPTTTQYSVLLGATDVAPPPPERPVAKKPKHWTKENFKQRFEEALTSGQIERDFETLPRGQQSSWDVAVLPSNVQKNRYNQIAAYDYNRVVLDAPEDYINASHITDYMRKKAYIAAQGPKVETLADFWRMIWQENVTMVVMMCKVSDQGKVRCQQYWPSMRGQVMMGEFQVSCRAEKTHGELVERDLQVQCAHGARAVTQLHFEAWPRQGVPSNLDALVVLMERLQTKRQAPVLIHCSGGTGRTGAVILADQLLRKLAYDNKVDVFGILKTLRQQRVNMVEKLEQYILVHNLVVQCLKL